MSEEINNKESLQVTEVGTYMMKGAAKWMNIIAIVAAIMTAILVLMGLFIMTKVFAVGLLYLVIAAIYAYPVMKTFGVSKNFNLAVDTMNNQALEDGLSNLKSLATFFGVLTVIGIVFFIIGLISGIQMINSI